jgi:hypothetical protein
MTILITLPEYGSRATSTSDSARGLLHGADVCYTHLTEAERPTEGVLLARRLCAIRMRSCTRRSRNDHAWEASPGGDSDFLKRELGSIEFELKV